jgi:molybdate transport system substrate-binding protein
LGPILRHLLERFDQPADLELAGSQVLRAQIEMGARPDLFFSANAEALTRLEGAGLVESRREFATTELVLVAREGFATEAPELSSLCELDARWVLASSQAPLGAYSDRLLRELGLDSCLAARVISRDPSATASLGRLRSGDADLGISYRSLVSEAEARDELGVFDLPATGRPKPRYLLARLRDVPHPEFARAFDEFLESPQAAELYPQFGMRPA